MLILMQTFHEKSTLEGLGRSHHRAAIECEELVLRGKRLVSIGLHVLISRVSTVGMESQPSTDV